MNHLILEEEIKQFVLERTNLTSSEKTKRIIKLLNFITDIYNKHQEEVPVNEAYRILFGE